MAHDLIAHHYLHTSRPIPQPQTSPAPHITFFNVLQHWDIRSWLFINTSDALPSPLIDPITQLLGHAIPTPKLTINSYDRRIMTWVHSPHFNVSQKNFSVHLLYEMRLASLSAESAAVAPEFTIREDPDWWARYRPEQISVVRDGGEKVYTVVSATGDRAAFVTVLRSTDGKRMYVSGLETFPDYRRRGFAKALMKHVEGVHARDGGEELWLTVFCENVNPVGMYHRLGYRIERCLWVVNYDDKVGDRRKADERC